MKRLILLLFLLIVFFQASSQQTIQAVNTLLLDAKYDEAIRVIDKKINDGNDLNTEIALKNKKAEALIHLGKFDEAEKVLKEAEQKIANKPGTEFPQAMTKTNEGFLYLNQGRNDLAFEALQKAIDQFEQSGKENTLEAAEAVSYLGQTYINTGKYIQAEEQLQRALALRQKQMKETNEVIAASYNDLGLVYSFMSDNDKALDYYDKALAIYQKLHGKENPKIAIANTNMGVVYRNSELYGDAVNNFEAALTIWEKVYTTAHPSKAFVLANLGQTYSKMGDQKAALGYYDRSLKMYQESYGKKHPDIARVLNAMGSIKLSLHAYDEALLNYQQALKANVSDFENDDVQHNPKLRNFYNGNILLYTLLLKAEALEGKYYGQTLKFQDLSWALQSLHTCDTLIDKLRQQITNEGDKLALGVAASEVYGDGVRISYNAGMNALARKKYFEESFYFAEKSKSAVLLEAISDSEAKSFAGIPVNMLEEEKNLKSAIAMCTQKLAQKPSADEEKYLRETSFTLNRNYEAFTKKLEQEFPEYFNLKYNSASPSIQQLQLLLNSKTAILSYFTDDKNARIYIFLISKNKFRIIDHVLPAEFDKYITGLRNSLFFSDLKTFTESSHMLYDLLIPKVAASITDLVILPTGRLSIIPFETLLTKKAEENQSDYKSLSYLLKKFSVQYEFSAGLLLDKSRQKQNTNASSIFLCAPVTFPEKDNLADLPGTASEVNGISNLFADKKLNRGLFINQQADEALIKSGQLKNYSLLHFATHGIVDEKDPELSRIYLQSNSDAEDGNLFAGEIYNLQLQANLVTLSACQTGLGKISKGEGVIGLSRALVYAGAKNVMVSFWSVADESTSELMKDFYKYLLNDTTSNYSENLRKAKLNLMNKEQYSAPYYWAPFILIGF